MKSLELCTALPSLYTVLQDHWEGCSQTQELHIEA